MPGDYFISEGCLRLSPRSDAPSTGRPGMLGGYPARCAFRATIQCLGSRHERSRRRPLPECRSRSEECRTGRGQELNGGGSYPFFSLAKRTRHAAQVTRSAGGSAQTDPAPGSSAQRAMRQWGVTAWKIAARPGRTRPDFRRETNTRPARTKALPARTLTVIVRQQSSRCHPLACDLSCPTTRVHATRVFRDMYSGDLRSLATPPGTGATNTLAEPAVQPG